LAAVAALVAAMIGYVYEKEWLVAFATLEMDVLGFIRKHHLAA